MWVRSLGGEDPPGQGNGKPTPVFSPSPSTSCYREWERVSRDWPDPACLWANQETPRPGSASSTLGPWGLGQREGLGAWTPMHERKQGWFDLSAVVFFAGNERGAPAHWWLSGKESTCDAVDVGWSLGLGRSPGGGNGNTLQYSCL